MKRAVQFGAGNIGRGFIGSLLSRSGYEVVFADINREIIAGLKTHRGYTVEIVGDVRREVEIGPVTGCLSDEPSLLDAIACADIVTTAVGPNVLKAVAATIARGLERRREVGNEAPLNVIACENMIKASSALRRDVEEHLPAETAHFVRSRVGFPDSAVDRIVPPMDRSDDILRVRVEEFSEWIVDRGGFRGDIPEIEGMQLTDNLPAFVERKLFTLNTGHAITAFLGALHGYRTIEESIADEQILSVVRGAMQESGEVLIRRYGFDRAGHDAYIEKILNRFRNPWLQDDVRRVARHPLRKLGFDDRLVKPLRGTLEYGTSNRNLIVGIAAALSFRSEDDEQARELRRLLDTEDIRSAIPRITSLDDEETVGAIENAYEVRGVQELLQNYVRNWTRIVTIREAETQFSQLVAEAMAGREVIVARNGKPMVRLMPVVLPKGETSEVRTFGAS